MSFRCDEDHHMRHHHDRLFLQKQSIGWRRKSKSLDVSPTSLASIESLSVPLVQEVVLPADIRCAECQKRVADVMYRMNGTESVVVNVWEKKVILSCKNPDPKTHRSKRQVVSYKTPGPFNKIAVIKRIFRSSLEGLLDFLNSYRQPLDGEAYEQGLVKGLQPSRSPSSSPWFPSPSPASLSLNVQPLVCCTQTHKNVVRLLQFSHRDHALLRVRQMINEHNIMDVYAMIEGYCNLLGERADLLKEERECLEELKETDSTIIYAASRCRG